MIGALRFDRGVLQKPQLVGESYVVEGHAARVHSVGDGLDYGDHHEYRDRDEVARIVAQLPGTTVTLDHPLTPLGSGGKAHVVGVVEHAWLDGEHAAVRMRITDRAAVGAMQLGTRELSLGYACTTDARGFQRGIQIDHLAIVTRARCGATCSISFDSAHSKGSLMIDPTLAPLAAQLQLNIDGLDTRDAAIKITTTASPSTTVAELQSKSDAYLVARATIAVESALRDRADAARRATYATDRREVGCACGGHSAPHADREQVARQKMIADSRMAHTLPTSITLETLAVPAIAPQTSTPIAGDREQIARARMIQESRDAHKQPLGTGSN